MSDTQAATAQPAWDVSQYEAALAHLERLQEQIDAMRVTIPAIVAPLSRRGRDKAQLFAEIKTAAVQSVQDVGTLRETWNSEQTKDLVARSKESFEKDGDLSKAAEVPRYGWIQEN